MRDPKKNLIGIKKIRGGSKNIMGIKKNIPHVENINDFEGLLLDTKVLVRRMFASFAYTMVLLHYFAKVLRILRFWPDIRVHKGQGSKKILGSKKLRMLKISVLLRGLLVDTRLLVGRMFESVANTMVLLQQECCESHGFG